MFNRQILCAMAWLCGLSSVAAADFRQDATDAIDAIAYVNDPAVFARVTTFFAESDAGIETWRDFFRDYYEDRDYTAATRQFWPAAARKYPAHESRWTQLALISATAALATTWTRGDLTPEALEKVQTILPALTDVAASASSTKGMFNEIWEAYRADAPLPLTSAFASGDQARVFAAMQAALLFAAFADGPRPVAAALSLPERTTRFLNEFGYFLFDGGALTSQQLAALASLADSIPRGIHNIVALTVPGGLGFDPVAQGIYAPGMIVPLDAAPLNALTDPKEFAPEVGRPVAPLFIARAARQYVRAIQTHEFVRRPELVWRRNAILHNAGTRRERYLRATVPPAIYRAQPDEFLPDLAFLYVVDSRALFREALELFHAYQRETMDQYLLLADLLSGGSQVAPLWRTAMDGAVYSAPATLGRTHLTRVHPPGLHDVQTTVAVDLNPITSIALGGRAWHFTLDLRGGVANLRERH